MTGPAAPALWLRAVNAAAARGKVPPERARLTPGELAAEAAHRGEDRLARLVAGWYYPTSYGRVPGALTDEEADRIVASLEADVGLVAPAPAELAPAPPPKRTSIHHRVNCDLCGLPLPPSFEDHDHGGLP